jgi:hypothetical protein
MRDRWGGRLYLLMSVLLTLKYLVSECQFPHLHSGDLKCAYCVAVRIK